MKVKLFVSLLMSFAMAAAVSAQPYGGPGYYPGAGPGMMQRAPVADAERLLRKGVAEMVAFIEAGGTGDEQKTLAFLNAKIAPYFDFPYMAKWVAGARYRYMSEAERSELTAWVQDMLMSTMARNITSYKGQKIHYRPQRSRDGKLVTVSAWLAEGNRYPTKLDFRFYLSDDGWKVYDVRANGTSALVYFRNEMNRSMRGPGMGWR